MECCSMEGRGSSQISRPTCGRVRLDFGINYLQTENIEFKPNDARLVFPIGPTIVLILIEFLLFEV
jgi:hypothetical protein